MLQDEDVHASTQLRNNKRDDRNIVDHDKLLFSVFSLLHNLGADERPEVYLLVISITLADIVLSHDYSGFLN